MKTMRVLAGLLLIGCLGLTAAAADTTVTLSDVHLCCGKCVTGVTTALKDITGVRAVSDMTAKTVVITASDKDAAQKAVNALVAAGYFGKSSDSSIKVDATTGATDAKVSTVEVSGLHLCCNSCVVAVNAILEKVPGVTANTAKTNTKTFTVSGNFSPKTLFDEFQKAGLTGKVVPAAAK